MRFAFPPVYELFALYYKVDPARWFPAPPPEQP
jgi:hypothetical protein